MFKYEMHLHSNGTSACGSSDAVEYIEAAKKNGYAGMVFTNHFYRGNTAISRELSWQEFVACYHEEYLRVREVGEKEGIDVLFGIEEGFGGGKECLIYGLDAETIALEKSFSKLPIGELSQFVRENGGFIAQAHPFRQRGYIPNPSELPNIANFDAIEVYNRGNTLEDNITAEEFARETGVAVIAGGDVHSVSGFGRSGVAFPERVSTGKDLVRLLKSGKYKLVADAAVGNVGNLFEYFDCL